MFEPILHSLNNKRMYLNSAAIGFLLLLAFALNSCIKDEPLNPEADIIKISLPPGVAISEPIFNGENIFIAVSKGENLNSISPTIAITEGASISPKSGEVQDFSKPVLYTVTSQSGSTQRKYKVILEPYSFLQTDFDNWETFVAESGKYKYDTPVEYSENGNKVAVWASSNPGVSIYQQFTDPLLYPVHKSIGGAAVVLETKKGPGNIMGIQNIPVVAGSLFTGSMNLSNALNDPLSSTRFGIFCDYLPDHIEGNYSYKAGAGDYIDAKGNAVKGKTDMCALYAVLFKVDAGVSYLDGNNILTHPNIVAITTQTYHNSTPGNELIPFDLKFVYKEGVVVDFEKNRYKIAVIFSSSYRGDLYEGTPGSKMMVDNVRIIKK